MGANYFLIPWEAARLVNEARGLTSKAERGAVWREVNALVRSPLHLGRMTNPAGGPLFIWNITPETFVELCSGPDKLVVIHEGDEGRVPKSWVSAVQFMARLGGVRHDFEHAGTNVWFR